MQRGFDIPTRGPGLHEITQQVSDWIAGRGDGLLTLFVRHTSASLLIQENVDPSVQRDLLAWLSRVAPHADQRGMKWITHRSEGPDDMPAHLKAAILPTSLTIPVAAGRLGLGTWQGIYLVEHRDAPRHRRVTGHFAADRGRAGA